MGIRMTTKKTISVCGRLDLETYKKFREFQKKNKIPVKSQAVEKIMYGYLNSTKGNGVTPLLQRKSNGGKALLCQLSDITEKMNEFEQNLKKEIVKK